MQELIPFTLFICIAYAIHAIADARARSKLVAPHVPEEVIRSLAVLEEERRRQGALRWGISLVCLALAMALLEAIVRAKPSAAKGQYLRSVTVSSTMGPGIHLDV